MKKALSLFMLMLLPVMAWAEPVEIDGIWYNLITKAKQAEVTNRLGGSYDGKNSYSGNVDIPSTVTYNGVEYSVTRIGSCAFIECSSLTSVTIPNSVIGIRDNAFYGCSDLTSVTIPNSVTWIGGGAFAGCSDLTSVTIPNSVTWIGSSAFYGCSALTSVTIPNSVVFIGATAFDGCISLNSITIGNGIYVIGYMAFGNFLKLTDVYCLAKNVPTEVDESGYCYDNSSLFKFSNIEHATLHVPAVSIDAYKAVVPWKNFKNIVALSDDEEIPGNPETSDTLQCATPVIIASGNKLYLECETPGAEFTSYLSTTEEISGEEVIIENKDRTYTLTVYATAPGYARSEPATMKIIFKSGDMNLDGSIDVADIATIIDKMAGK